ncbi:MAG: hypothetical protein K6B45_07015 [Bacteroidaceae bacterium]|nr:hypothetical protein [Bacteroidaceae bacterium]
MISVIILFSKFGRKGTSFLRKIMKKNRIIRKNSSTTLICISISSKAPVKVRPCDNATMRQCDNETMRPCDRATVRPCDHEVRSNEDYHDYPQKNTHNALKGQKNIAQGIALGIFGYIIISRPERAKEHSPGHRPGYIRAHHHFTP